MRVLILIKLALLGFAGSAQYSQLLFIPSKSLIIKEFEYNDRILFLNRVTNTHSEFAEFYEFDLSPDNSDFIKRCSFQLSNDSLDYLTKEEYSKWLSSRYQSTFKKGSSSNLVVFEGGAESGYPKFGDIPHWVWQNPKVIDLYFSSKENLMSFSMSIDADVYNKELDKFSELNEAYREYYLNLIFRSVQHGYYSLHDSHLDVEINDFGLQIVMSNLVALCYGDLKILKSKYDTSNFRQPFAVSVMVGFPAKGYMDMQGKLNSSYGRLYEKLLSNDTLFSGKGAEELNHREVFSKSDNRNFITLLSDKIWASADMKKVDESNPFRIVYSQLNSDDSLVRSFFYQLPFDMVLFSENARHYAKQFEMMSCTNPDYEKVMKFFPYWEAANKASISNDGALFIFARKGLLEGHSISKIEQSDSVSVPGLFYLTLTGSSNFIPNEELFDKGVYRDSTVLMIQSKNGALWLIGFTRQEGYTSYVLLVQDAGTSKFRIHCSLPNDFKVRHLSEVTENVITIVGEQKGNSANSSFVPLETDVNSVLLMNANKVYIDDIKKGAVTNVDLESGHIHYSNFETKSNYFFPIQMKRNSNDLFEGVLLLEGEEIPFKKSASELMIKGEIFLCREISLESVLTEVIKYYYLRK